MRRDAHRGLHRVARGYWPCVWERSRPGVDVVVVRDMHEARAVCRNANRRGYTVWRKRNSAGTWSLTLAYVVCQRGCFCE